MKVEREWRAGLQTELDGEKEKSKQLANELKDAANSLKVIRLPINLFLAVSVQFSSFKFTPLPNSFSGTVSARNFLLTLQYL